jgi:hypothetical protein
MSKVSNDSCDCDPGKKSARLVHFQELVRDYFVADDCKEGLASLEIPASQIFPEIPSSHELSGIVSSVYSYLSTLESGLSNLDEFALRISDAAATDYASLAVTKFLHGIGSCRASYSTLRTNPLFGRFQGARFTELEQAVNGLL